MNPVRFNVRDMKKQCLLLLAIAALSASTVAAQDTNTLKTEIGQFENRTGSVIVKGFSFVGSITASSADVSVRCKETTDVSIGRKVYGLAIQIDGSGFQPERVYVDENEIDPLLTGLNYLIKISYDVTALPGFEATYTTKGGLQIIANSVRREGGVRYSLEGNDTPPIALTSLQMTQLYGLIGQARKNLDAIKAGK
jgi:hypothetical protein